MLSAFFRNKKILLLGGTGSIGSQILKSLIVFNPKLIRIFSRDEYKQHKLRYQYMDYKNIDYTLGDVSDLDSLVYTSEGFDVIFHCAALKHVSISEEMPEAFIKTNIIGSLNVKKAAIKNRIPLTVSISSDKAVDPGNLMGLTKAVQEKIFSSHLLKEKTPGVKFINVRFDNVIGTHGSLFPILYHQITNGKPITITNREMTRFYMSSDEAIQLIFWAAVHGKDGEIIIKKMKSAKIVTIIDQFLSVMKKNKNWPTKSIGIRVGEKIHEQLITEDNLYRIREESDYYVISPYNPNDITRDKVLIRDKSIKNRTMFNSNFAANYLTKNELAKYIQDFIKNVRLQNQEM